MATKTATANGQSREDASYANRISEYLRELKAIRKEIASERATGKKLSANIRRQHKQIQSILNRVEAIL